VSDGDRDRLNPDKLLPPRFHACHSCDHQVWYELEDTAKAVSPYPCPWCGGEAGTPARYNVLNTVAGRIYPAPDMVAPDKRGGHGIIVHRADESCYKGRRVPKPMDWPSL
jgi:hypothetical protein